MKKGIVGALILASILFLFAYQKYTLFVVQPIGALPDGITVVIDRGTTMHFIDSADALCQRQMGKVSLLCRGIALAEVSKGKIYARLPYFEWLYLWSTDGAKYEK